MRGETFEQFVERSVPRLLRIAGPLTANSADAEDVVQETLIRVMRHWGRVSHADNPDAYVTKAVTNEAARRSRQSSTGIVADGAQMRILETTSDQDAQLSLDRIHDQAELRALLGVLNRNQRTALVLRIAVTASYAEIADVLRCRETTARSHVNRALNKLRAVQARLSSEPTNPESETIS